MTNFTGADAVVTIFDGNDVEVTSNFTVTQTTPGASSNRTIKIEGTSLAECGSIHVNVKWGSSNTVGVITSAWSVVYANGVEYIPEVIGTYCN